MIVPASIIINDASLPFRSSSECSDKLAGFFGVIHQAKIEKVTLNRADGYHGSWNSFVYAKNFEFGEWINKIEDKDLSRIVKNVVSNVDCSSISFDGNTKEILDNIIYFLSSDKKIEVQSLGVASSMGAHAISFQSNEKWEFDPISIVRCWDECGVWKEKQHNVPNITTLIDFNIYLKKIVAERQLNRLYLKTLEVNNNQDFPNIVFFESALKNLKSPSVTEYDFPKIIETLNRLSSSILEVNTQEELSLNTGLSISRESTETMNNPKYSRQRYFKNPAGRKVCCDMHVKNFSSGKRMHIAVDFTLRVVSVGYFGRHLPTVTYPK
jgi:hypothetical protein